MCVTCLLCVSVMCVCYVCYVLHYLCMVSKPRRRSRVLPFVRLVCLYYATVVHVVYVFILNSTKNLKIKKY